MICLQAFFPVQHLTLANCPQQGHFVVAFFGYLVVRRVCVLCVCVVFVVRAVWCLRSEPENCKGGVFCLSTHIQ